MERKSELLSSKEKQKMIVQLIVFRVGDEEFGVPIDKVQEIIKITAITPIPDSPDFIKGLINVRGDIVAIIDVRARFFLTMEEEEASRHIVIVKQEGSLFGLMVNEVMEVLRIQESDVKPPPQLMTKINEDYVYGVITHDTRLIILLDVEKVLSEDELIRLTMLTRKQREKVSKMDSEEIKDKAKDEDDLTSTKKKTAHSKKNME